ncbi:MAG: ribonuclease Y [Actinomycetota bacterium]|nr:ribonuclease Y [Actinomycetota bacterium]MDK1015959.1 ribonuclease Y [Actinomycetota bacterium]MDK1026971.1 ribonuclease Y [Actinomycetota bacterium]MDK1038030.1 ribonuclease Y [Actinomycetota bacterium]MDK1096512.1 ribonuclease Y [Actinomycetota bacterium]
MEQTLSLLIPGLVVSGVFLGGLLVGRRLIKIPPAPDEIISDARVDAQRILARAEEDARALADTYRDREDATLEHRRVEIDAKSSTLEHRAETLEQRGANLAQREELVIDMERAAKEVAAEAARSQEEARLELEALAGFDSRAAKEELLQKVEDEARRDAMVLVRDIETRAREEALRRSRRILAGVIQRVASEVVAETTTSTVPLPSDDMKGRIIGKDGRNIRSFEAIAGVDLIVDDTPESVSVSTFDPVRREVARLALTRLVEDGRIHPSSIEEAHEKAKDEVEQSIRDAGEWAMLDVGLTRIHPELVTLIGRLKYRTSYGQNVLNHLIESAHIAGMLAAELGVDEAEVKRAAFLHDIGKAVSHEVGGSHALIGAEIARRFGEGPAIVHAIEAHHNEVEPRTLTAVLVQAADAVSAARPGARREALDSYVRRLEQLEEIAMDFDGVERAFALQAGREVRVVVDPGTLDDMASKSLARSIARRLEHDLQYPGQIEVTVIREFRAKDYAR